jgi:hypothetical protein
MIYLYLGVSHLQVLPHHHLGQLVDGLVLLDLLLPVHSPPWDTRTFSTEPGGEGEGFKKKPEGKQGKYAKNMKRKEGK